MAASSHAPGRPGLAGLASKALVTPRAFTRLALANLAATFLIIVTGAAVRLTGSGLGCPDWPNCHGTQFVAPLQLHPAIEDANRLVTGLLVALTIVTLLAALARRPRRADLAWLSAGLVGGIIADALLGARSSTPSSTRGSSRATWPSASRRSSSQACSSTGLGTSTARPRDRAAVPMDRPARAMVVGRARGHAARGHGDDRLGPALRREPGAARREAAAVHAPRRGVGALGLRHGLHRARRRRVLVLHRTGAATKVTRGATRLLVVGAAQGVLGVTQYTTHLPVVLVEVHVIGAVAITIGVLHFQLAQTARDLEPSLEARARRPSSRGAVGTVVSPAPIVQRPRTPPFQGGNTGSNPVGGARRASDQRCGS